MWNDIALRSTPTSAIDSKVMERAIVIFGAAIGEHGLPSPCLVRRTHYGLAAAQSAPEAPIFCSGGVGRFGPSEASAMRDMLLAASVSPARIVLDERSRDTLQNVVAASRYIRLNRLEGAVICSDDYHHPRIKMLFACIGVEARSGPVRTGPAPGHRAYWLGMCFREMMAYPYDLGVMLFRGAKLRRRIGREITPSVE